MHDLHFARTLLEKENYTCVICRGEDVLTDRRRGVKPLMELLESGKDLHGFSAADKVVGKAAGRSLPLLPAGRKSAARRYPQRTCAGGSGKRRHSGGIRHAGSRHPQSCR